MADSVASEKDSFESFPTSDSHEDALDQGERFSHFKDILMKCTEKCFAPARLEKISPYLADVRARNPEAFDSIIQQLVDSLHTNVKQELELMIKQENLVSLCHELDHITGKSKESSPAWRPSGKPNEDIKDHVMHVKLQFRKKLKEKLNLLQSENQAIQENVVLLRSDVTSTEERITEKHMTLQKITEACDCITGDNNNLNEGKGSLKRTIADLS